MRQQLMGYDMGELLAKYATFFTEMKEIIFKARNEAH